MPLDSDAIPIPGEWEYTGLKHGLLTLETPLSVIATELPAPEILDRLKVGELYRLTLTPAYVTVATSDPAPE